MPQYPLRRSLLALLALVGASHAAQAQTQVVLPQQRAISAAPLVRPAFERDELARLDALRDTTTRDAATRATRYSTLRAPSRQLPWPSRGSTRTIALTLLTPELTLGHNSQLPYGFNDGPSWQGRGLNLQITAGIALTLGPLRVIVAPQYLSSANTGYQTIPYRQDASENRSQWANPFHPAPGGIDLPLRFGDQPLHTVDAGQSSVTLRLPLVELGVSTENVWWGPGMQNAILWGSQGAGVPSAFLRTRAPIKTRLGTWDAWYTVGDLRESDYFDRSPANDHRSQGAIAIAWQPPHSTGVEFGIARLVILADSLSGRTFGAPFRTAGRPNGPDSLSHGIRDQITSLWARWAPPGVGFETWAEWARFEEPASLRDFLESPGHSQGYTVGLQWARPLGAGTARLWGEATYLEPSPSLRLRPVGTTYVSRSVPQGFTVRGQPLGAGIGPGSSSQWAGGDWVHAHWRVGAYAARVRWDNAVLFTPIVPHTKYEDLSLINGLRLGGDWHGARVLLDWAHAIRLNYLFQSYNTPIAGRTQGIDIVNDAITITLSTPWQLSSRPASKPASK